jgi:membrane-associated phospholipid phosphatase
MAIVCLASLGLDHWAYEHLTYASIYDHDWGRLLRVMGFWPTWCVAALALWLNERITIASARRRALLLVASPAVAGLSAEALKLVLRRERPDAHSGVYAFRPFADHPFSTAGIGSPSSHGMLTRVLARAHFLSDGIVGAAVGLVVGVVAYGHFPARVGPASKPAS